MKITFWISFRCNNFVINFITKLLQGKYAFRLSKIHPNIILSHTLDPQTNCASNQTSIVITIRWRDQHDRCNKLHSCNNFHSENYYMAMKIITRIVTARWDLQERFCSL